jgi:hypothetical protein
VLAMTTNEEINQIVDEITEEVLDVVVPSRAMRKRIDKLELRIREERHWIDQHGGNLLGYISRYGASDDPNHYGDGGELIYRADVACLARLESEYEQLTGVKF